MDSEIVLSIKKVKGGLVTFAIWQNGKPLEWSDPDQLGLVLMRIPLLLEKLMVR